MKHMKNSTVAQHTKMIFVYSLKFFVPVNREVLLEMSPKLKKKDANNILPMTELRFELMPNIE